MSELALSTPSAKAREAYREGVERLGFFACQADLEDELIRAVGTAGVEAVDLDRMPRPLGALLAHV